MPSYAPSFTGRYRCKYFVCGIEHTIQLRRALGATPGSVALLAGTVESIFNAVSADLCTDFAFISAEQADEGSDLFYPSTTPNPVVGAGVGPSAYTPFQKVTHTRFHCRGTGSRSSIEMYGIRWQYSNTATDADQDAYNGVATPDERAYIGTVAGLLNTQAFPNNGGPGIWAARATVKINDFWLHAVRSGGIT